MKTPKLSTDRVALRPLDLEDLDEVFALHNDLQIKILTLSWPLPVTREACRGWIAARETSDSDATWAVVSRSADFLGVARAFELDNLSRRAELGLYLRPDARGTGAGSDVLALLRDWAFAFLGLHRLEARILASNTSALRLFEKSGFEREGLLRQREYRLGTYHDVVLLAVLAQS